MRTRLYILIFFLSTPLFGQHKTQIKEHLNVYQTADSLFNKIQDSGIDTILLYFLRRNSSEVYTSKDNSSDYISAYLFWQTADSCYIKKVNPYTIYETRSESRRMQQNSEWSIATVFDYYKAKKPILDNQVFRPNIYDLSSIDKIIGKDTMWLFSPFTCADCHNSVIKYKIGKTQKEKDWTTMYLDRDNEFFNFNICSELYHWTLILNQTIAHPDRNQWWRGTKYKY